MQRNFFPFFVFCFLGNQTEQIDIVLDTSLTLKNVKLIEKNGLGHGEAGWWKEQLENANADQNGSLSFDEFKE